MALATVYETWVKKKAQIDQKKLQIADIRTTAQSDMSTKQAEVEAIRTTAENEVAVKQAEIAALEADIKAIVL